MEHAGDRHQIDNEKQHVVCWTQCHSDGVDVKDGYVAFWSLDAEVL